MITSAPADLAEIYSRQVAELADLIEAERRRHDGALTVLTNALAELRTALTEIATTAGRNR